MTLEHPVPSYARRGLIFCAVTQFLSYFCTKPWAGRECLNLSVKLDDVIPLRDEWVIVYILSYVFWMIGYIFVCRQGKAQAKRLFIADFVGKIVSAAFFLIMPTTIDRPAAPGGVMGWMLGVIYFFDSPSNLFPSMHCFFSWLVFRMVARTNAGRIWKWISFIFAVMVFLSTVFTKQHFVVDIPAGVVLAEIALLVSDIVTRRTKAGTDAAA